MTTVSPTATAVVVLSARLGAVLPAGAVSLLRSGALLYGDDDLPQPLADALDADPVEDQTTGLLLTLDPTTGMAARWVATGARVVRTPEPSGAGLLDAVSVMDRLRSPGGCPWDAEQTHSSLLPYLIEETYELYQAVEDGDRAALREELGDVLLQVLFHARIGSEWSEEPIDVDDVADVLVTKLVRRHPHVFAGTEQVHTAGDQQRRWEELKHSEKRRSSAVDGVALGQPAAALATKIVSRASTAGVPTELLVRRGGPGAELFATVARTGLAGADPEGALRTAARRLADDVRAAESSARSAGLDPAALTREHWQEHWPHRRVAPSEQEV